MEGSTLFSEENSKHVKKFFSDLISTVTACKDDGEDPLEPDSPGGLEQCAVHSPKPEMGHVV